MPQIRSFALFVVLILAGLASRAGALYLTLDFSIDRQTYSWADSLSVNQALGARGVIELFNRSGATLFRESIFGKGGDRWQKSAVTQGKFSYRLSSRVSAGVSLSQDFDRLEEKRFIGNRLFLTNSYQGDRLSVMQSGGLLFEERKFEPQRNQETGLGYEAKIRFVPINPRWGVARLEGEITTPRQTPRRMISLGYDLANLTFRSDTLSLSGNQFFSLRKYFPSTGTFEAIARQSSEQRRWDMAASKALPLAARLSVEAAYRYDRYDYEYEGADQGFIRQNDNLTSVLEYQFGLSRAFYDRFDCQLAYLFNRTDEDFGSSLTNQLSETGQLTARMLWQATRADTVELSGQIGVTSYFAPTNSAFFADRDRAARLASFRAVHRFSDFLTGVVDGSARELHLVYISGSLSANNNINNVYILNPSLIWRPVRAVTLQQNYQMHANYIYYEFEKNAVSERNTLYRRANLVNTLAIKMSPRFDLVVEYAYRFEDFGRLIWEDQWKQQVSWDRRTHRPRLGIEYRPVRGFRFYPYASHEWQTFYDHLFDPESTLGRRVQSDELRRSLIGFELQWTMSANSYVDCRLERRVQEYQKQRSQDYDVFTITLKRYL